MWNFTVPDGASVVDSLQALADEVTVIAFEPELSSEEPQALSGRARRAQAEIRVRRFTGETFRVLSGRPWRPGLPATVPVVCSWCGCAARRWSWSGPGSRPRRRPG